MATFPESIPTRQVRIPAGLHLENADQLTLHVEVEASRSLIWAGGLVDFVLKAKLATVVGEAGKEALLDLPVTDVAGWRLLSGQAIELNPDDDMQYTHRYTMRAYHRNAAKDLVGDPITIGPFILPSGDEPVNVLDRIQAGSVPGLVVSIPDTWSKQHAEILVALEDGRESSASAARDAERAVNGQQGALASAQAAAGSAGAAQSSAATAVGAAGRSETAAEDADGFSRAAGTALTNATGQAEAAAESRRLAGLDRTAASQSATTASTKAGEASTSAQTATTKAGEAAGSASTASGAAQTATTKAGEATTAAGTASSAAGTATGAADRAETALAGIKQINVIQVPAANWPPAPDADPLNFYVRVP